MSSNKNSDEATRYGDDMGRSFFGAMTNEEVLEWLARESCELKNAECYGAAFFQATSAEAVKAFLAQHSHIVGSTGSGKQPLPDPVQAPAE